MFSGVNVLIFFNLFYFLLVFPNWVSPNINTENQLGEGHVHVGNFPSNWSKSVGSARK